MQSSEQILRLLKKELPYLQKTFKVKRIGIFGSRVRGEQTEKSDIDLLVEFEKPLGFFAFIELEDYLSKRLGARVDLVTPDALKPLIKPHIMKETVYA
ncbi:MAG: nucleotidyltransferase family protein [Candidatus Heimdallarchaeota archaeon]